MTATELTNETICVKKSCLICKYFQFIYGPGMTNDGYYTCGADNPVYGSVRPNTVCKLFEVNPEIIKID